VKDYYDFSVKLMDTHTYFKETGKVSAQTGKPLAVEDGEVDDPETNKRWRLQGFWQAPVLDKDDLLAMLKRWSYTDGDSIHAQVHDNGRGGDGLWLSFYPCARAGTPETNPEKFGTMTSETAPAALFTVRLTPKQAKILGVALKAAAEMWEAQER
jgi:hypothetical protein